MTLSTLFGRLGRHKLAITLLVLIGAVGAMFGSFALDLEYQTSSRYIVIQEQRFPDAFTQAKSAEYLAGLLSNIVNTDSFRVAVFEDSPHIVEYFPEDKNELRKEWIDKVQVKPEQDIGIVEVSVFSTDVSQAESTVFAIGDTLINNVKDYLGNSTQVVIRPIDGPFTSELPVRPNFVKNTIAGALVGILVGILMFGLRNSNSSPKSSDFGKLGKKVAPLPIPPRPKNYPRPISDKLNGKPAKTNTNNGGTSFKPAEFEAWLHKK